MSLQKNATPNSSENQSPSLPANPILSLRNTEIIDVWEHNFEEELYKIMDLVEDYNLVSLVFDKLANSGKIRNFLGYRIPRSDQIPGIQQRWESKSCKKNAGF